MDLGAQKQVASIPVGNHPTSLHLDGTYLFVANTNSDSVSVIDTASRQVAKTISTKPFPDAPLGSSPQGVTTLPDGRIAVALGDSNALAVYRWSGPSDPTGFEGLVPTGWYPGDVVVDPALNRLVVANVKGVGSLGDGNSSTKSAYSTVGSVSTIAYPTSRDLAGDTATVFTNNDWHDLGNPSAGTSDCSATGHQPLGPCSPIKHVFLIIKENRTYDQVLGDMKQGNGDPANTTFGGQVTPNQHALATRFPLLDNYYASGIASDEGHQWLDEAWVSSYLEKMEFGGPERGYPYDGGDSLAYAPSGFLWQNAQRHGLSVRDYGEFASQFSGSGGSVGNWVDPDTWKKFYQDSQILAGKQQGKLNTPLGTYTAQSDVPSLKNVLSPYYPPFNTASIPDQYRLQIFLREFHDYEAHHNLPNLMTFTLPQDHTAGTTPGFPTPNAMVADNDLALGKIVQAISHSPDWKDSAIFVTEDDAQNGLDHVDGHRTTGFVISPYARTGTVDTTYTQIDMVRSIEQILGLPPMNQFDMAATPMTEAFTDKPDFTPFTALPEQIPVDQLSPSPQSTSMSPAQRSWSRWSAQQFNRSFVPDSQNTAQLNRDIWYATKASRPPTQATRKSSRPLKSPALEPAECRSPI